MDETTYARRYHRRLRDVRRWLDGGRLRGAVRDEHGAWTIPDDAKPELYLRKRRNRTRADDMYDILRALDSYRIVDAEVLGCSEGDFADELLALQRTGLIVPSGTPADGVTGMGFSLTWEGSEVAGRGRDVFAKVSRQVLVPVFTALAEGAAEGTIAAMLGA